KTIFDSSVRRSSCRLRRASRVKVQAAITSPARPPALSIILIPIHSETAQSSPNASGGWRVSSGSSQSLSTVSSLRSLLKDSTTSCPPPNPDRQATKTPSSLDLSCRTGHLLQDAWKIESKWSALLDEFRTVGLSERFGGKVF